MSLIDSVAVWVLENLAYDRDDPDVVAALKAKPPAELLVIYLTSQSRLIRPLPRKVLRSSTFDANPIVNERSFAVGKIIKDIEQGDLLTKYLSKRVVVGFELPRDAQKKDLNHRKDLDLLLNDWDIHHLHISTEVAASGFVKRGNPLLFAIFRPGHTYLIDVADHGQWTDDRFIRVILENWPDAGLVAELVGIRPSESSWSSRDRIELRGAGIAAGVAIDGRVYMPGPGISSDGSSPRTLWKASNVLRELKKFEDQKDKFAKRIIEEIRKRGGRIDGPPEYRFSVFSNGFGVVETKSGMEIFLGQ